MAPFGYEPEGRGFKPHLTLGRVRRKVARGDVAQVGQVVGESTVGMLGEVSVESFDLIRSVLKPTGAEYTTLKGFPLKGGG